MRRLCDAEVIKIKCGESLESGGRFYVGAFGGKLTSVAVTMFSHLIYFL
jgi:hypothetical protein